MGFSLVVQKKGTVEYVLFRDTAIAHSCDKCFLLVSLLIDKVLAPIFRHRMDEISVSNRMWVPGYLLLESQRLWDFYLDAFGNEKIID